MYENENENKKSRVMHTYLIGMGMIELKMYIHSGDVLDLIDYLVNWLSFVLFLFSRLSLKGNFGKKIRNNLPNIKTFHFTLKQLKEDTTKAKHILIYTK